MKVLKLSPKLLETSHTLDISTIRDLHRYAKEEIQAGQIEHAKFALKDVREHLDRLQDCKEKNGLEKTYSRILKMIS